MTIEGRRQMCSNCCHISNF